MSKVIKGNVYIGDLSLFELPDFLKDVVVEGNFCCDCNSLTTLEGAPKEVGGYFYCNNNPLTSLEGAPEKVGGEFYCQRNSLTTLEGLPKEIGRSMYISFAPGISFTEEEIRKISNIKGFIYIRR
jgi:hypothetical protein